MFFGSCHNQSTTRVSQSALMAKVTICMIGPLLFCVMEEQDQIEVEGLMNAGSVGEVRDGDRV